MSLTAAQIVALRAPDYASDSRLADLISLAETGLSSTAFGSRYPEAVALQVCHWLAKESRAGAAGPVTSETEGGLSRSYAVSASADDLLSTSYGAELKQLRDSILFKPLNRMMGT